MLSCPPVIGKLESGVNNVELKTATALTGVAERRSTPHYWALNISPVMLSST